MALKKPVPLVLLLFTVMCVLSAATTAAVTPSAIAQEEEDDDMSLDDEEENLASGTVSNVLDNGNTARDDTEVSVPITDIDQTDANFGLSGALDVTVERTLSPQEEEPPECAVEITADKEIYGPLDVVAITITNTGDIPLVFPTSLIGLEIRNVDTGEVLLLDALPAVTTLEPGDSQTFRFEYEDLVREIGTGLISATVTSDCGTEEDTFRLLEAPID